MPKPVAKLKSEGQALIAKGDFNTALKKFSLALGQADTDTQLLVGRATCLNALKRYRKAMDDVNKATQIDENCHEGWIQLASSQEGLSGRTEAISILERGLEILSNAPVSERKEALTKEYNAKIENLRMADTNAAVSELPGRLRFMAVKEGEYRFPWDRAIALVPTLLEEGNRRSSAHVIAEAYKANLKPTSRRFTFELTCSSPDVPKSQRGHEYAGVDSNANRHGVQRNNWGRPGLCVLDAKDTRAFNMDREWMRKYLEQVKFEVGALEVPEPHGPTFVLEHITVLARELLKEGGWDAVRPAIAAAVSISIMHGLHTANIVGDLGKCIRFYDGAVEIIRWGQKEWPEIPRAQRGVVFDDIYLRALRSLRLEKYIDAWMEVGDDGPRFTLEGILEEADDILEELTDPSTPVVEFANQPGFASSFFYYLEANCYACKGFYYLRKGYKLRHSGSKRKAKEHFDQAAIFYEMAAKRYPPDDEKSIQFFDMNLRAMFKGEQPLRKTLPIVSYILQADKDRTVRKIWEFSPLCQRLDSTIELLKTFTADVERKLRAGSLSMDSRISPSWASDG